MSDLNKTPVVVVGGGPVGMVLAMNLAALGTRSVLVNAEPTSRWHPKGGTQNARTMEHYRRLGIARQLRTLGLPADHPTDVGYFTSLNGWELARLAMPSEREKQQRVRDAAPTDQEPEPLFRCNQMYVERYLFEHLQTLDSVDMRYGWNCVSYRDEGDHVAVEIEEISSGRRESFSCAYLVGCDGGQSFVRRGLGIRYSGDKVREQSYAGGATVSTYLRSPRLYDRVLRRKCWQYWTVSATVRSVLSSLDGAGEFLFSTRVKSLDTPPDPEAIGRQFRLSVGEDVPFELVGHWPWTAGQALVADHFGVGRVLVAGDAVHLFTPTGGFGMNTGIDDAANLGWKLAALTQGWGGPGLAGSFEIERRPIALRNTGAARRMSHNVGDVPLSPAMREDTAEGAAARRAAGDFLSTFGEEFASLGVQLGARYDGSPVIAGDGTAPPADDPATYTPSACPGGRAPHLWLDDRSSLFDHFGQGFTLLRLGEAASDGSALAAAARARGIPFTVLSVPVSAARDLYGRDLALIRPDQHVAWRGNRLPEDCNGLLAHVTGW